MEAEDCVFLAYKRGNIVKVQQYPHDQPPTRSDMDVTIPCIPHKGVAVIHDTLSFGKHIYNADASRMRTHEWNGGEIPTDPDQYDRLVRRLFAVVSREPYVLQTEQHSLPALDPGQFDELAHKLRTVVSGDHTVPPLVPYSDTESDEEPCTNDNTPAQRDNVTPPKPSTAKRNRRKRDKRLSRGNSPSTPPPELSGAMSGISLEAGVTTRGARYGEDLETPAVKHAHRVTNRYIAEQL